MNEEKQPSEETAKVLIVTETGGRERRYNAIEADDDEYGHLRLLREGRKVVATYQPNAWLSVREDGALAWDQSRLIATLRDALAAAWDALNLDTPDPDAARKIIVDALDATDPDL